MSSGPPPSHCAETCFICRRVAWGCRHNPSSCGCSHPACDACRYNDHSGPAVLVGERFNLGDGRDRRLPGTERWRELCAGRLFRLGAFLRGAGRARLQRCGARWDASLNLLWPAPVGSGDARRAAEVAAAVLPAFSPFNVAYFAGRRVAAAFGLDRLVPAPWVASLGHLRVVVLPHPSGRCRWWNQAGSELLVRDLVLGAPAPTYFTRADGRAPCERCSRPYREHPTDPRVEAQDLHRTCGGELVKL